VGAAFGLVGQRGLAEVAFGLASLDRVLVSFEPASETTPSVPRDFTSRLPDAESADDLVVQSHHDSKSRGELHVLPFGRVRPPSPADFVGSSSVRHVVAELARTHDIVIVDTPPTIPVSDALTISEYVDAAIVVTRLASSQRPTLRSLRKLLATFRTPMLGLVVTGVAEEEGYGPYFVRGPAPAEPIAHPVR
jgi:Mrp family chromosome partitioning ATPase